MTDERGRRGAAVRDSARLAPAARRRRAGVALGTLIASSVLLALTWPGNEHWSAAGPMNSGHEGMACNNCHRPAPGTLRQQLQANARFVLGMRRAPVDFGERSVENSDCTNCHDRPFDRHPVSRFTEPRFADARAALTVHQCQGCHREHSGARVTTAVDYCSHCHGDLQLASDPLDKSHAELARERRFETCLGCHDFHGNHLLTFPKQVGEAIPLTQLEEYFAGGASPYPNALRQTAKKERD